MTFPEGMMWIVYLSILGGLVLYFMTAEERARLLRWLLRACQTLWWRTRTEAVRFWAGRRDADEQPSIALATGFIVLANLWVFGGVLVGAAPFTDPATLLSWGASSGTRTTNGEWWRLVTATFVHTGLLDMLVMLAGFIQIGAITERLVGRLAFCFVYLGAGTVANLIGLFTSSVGITTGSAAAVLGVYGLFAATWTWSLLRGSRIDVPWRTMKRLMPGVVIFLLYIAATHRLDGAAAVAACAGGMIQGLLLATGARDHKPKLRRVAMVTADTVALVALFAVPIRGMADVRPVVERLIATEARTTSGYEAAVARFTKGTVPAAALVRLIDDGIRPELQAVAADLRDLERVPRDQTPLAAAADEYLRLRDESWRLRSEALRKSRTRMLKDADRVEWQAREALTKLKSMNQK